MHLLGGCDVFWGKDRLCPLPTQQVRNAVLRLMIPIFCFSKQNEVNITEFSFSA